MIDPNVKLIAIVGTTASGKTDLAIKLAKKFNGEIICADSRTVYRGMDIGTAKPTASDREEVPHHLVDVVDPDQVLGAAAFKRLAESAIADISGRGKLPFLVGGSGLYIDSVLYDYNFPPANSKLRTELEKLSNEQLKERLLMASPEEYELIDLGNRRRVVRAIETVGQPRNKSDKIRPNTLVLGLELDKEVIQNRIELRVKKMLEEGFFDEVQQIATKYGWDCEALSAIGYRAFKDAVSGHISLEEAASEFVQGDVRLAKKQRTWFHRNNSIIWLKVPSQAEGLVAKFLALPV